MRPKRTISPWFLRLELNLLHNHRTNNIRFWLCGLSNGRKTGRRGFTGEPRWNVKESALRYHVSDEGTYNTSSFSLFTKNNTLTISFVVPQNLIEQNQQQARQILIQNPILTKALFQVLRAFNSLSSFFFFYSLNASNFAYSSSEFQLITLMTICACLILDSYFRVVIFGWLDLEELFSLMLCHEIKPKSINFRIELSSGLKKQFSLFTRS